MAKKKSASKKTKMESPNAHFFDSGSFSLWARATKEAQEKNVGEWAFYNTPEFEEYLNGYASFVREYRAGIDVCANVDVLPFRTKRGGKIPKGMDNAELSYRNLKKLESMGLRPVPVVHYRTDIDKWLRRYIEEGYPMIGLGGLVGSITDAECRNWINRCFNFICQSNEKPCVKLHGFGVTSHEYLLRYPWYSVDSTTWTKHAAYGHILIPRKRRGKFIFTKEDLARAGLPTDNWAADCQPWLVTMSKDSGKRKDPNSCHYLVLKPSQQKVMEEWLELIGVPLGSEKGDVEGAITHHNYRQKANLLFFEHLRHSLPNYSSWKWKCSKMEGFGLNTLQSVKPPKKCREFYTPQSDKLIIFYSGSATIAAGPEADLRTEANIMLTYHDMHKRNKPDSRFQRVLDARRRAAKKAKKPPKDNLACV